MLLEPQNHNSRLNRECVFKDLIMHVYVSFMCLASTVQSVICCNMNHRFAIKHLPCELVNEIWTVSQ